MIYKSSSSADTKKFAEKIAKRIANSRSRIANRKHATILALVGDLGSGKTTFVQGFFRGLGIKKRATSPTFILMRRVTLPPTRYPLLAFKNVYHIDVCRLKKPQELLKLGFKEILENPRNVVLIEWADKVKKILPRKILRLTFVHGRAEKFRTIRIG